MRAIRQNAILSIVAQKDIQTQEELSLELRALGYDVTQATVSRDIKELRLVKVRNDRGIVCYRADAQADSGDVEQRLRSILKHSMVSVDSAENDVVIKTLPGVAQAAAAALDAMRLKEIVGTIAGDDTILMIARSAKSAIDVMEKLKKV